MNKLLIKRLSSRDLAYCGLFGAAALLLPVLFHLVRLGHVFMPMYLPLMTLAFFVPPAPAAATALVVPLLSGAVSGMPPFYPPVSVFMSIELAVMSALIAAVVTRRPRVNEWLVLAPTLLFGRALYVGLVYVFSLAVALPAGFLAGLSLLSGWPGLALMFVVVPPVARLRKGRGGASAAAGRGACSDTRTRFFDGIADRWDGWEDLPKLAEDLAAGIEEFGVGRRETVLDVGCGTGNLTAALLDHLSPEGRVIAADAAPRMIAAVRRKVRDRRVRRLVADVRRLPLPDSSCDRAICFSVWPHIGDREAAAAELRRVLRPGGVLHIWHLSSRAKINEIHAAAGGPICRDVLPPAAATAALLERHGFGITASIDNERRYLVTGVLEDPGGAAEGE